MTTQPRPSRCIVLGAAGRDFHDIQTFFRPRATLRVVAITAAQIPFINDRSFPHELAGPAYDEDIPIRDESELPQLIRDLEVDFVFLCYSDLSHEEVMHKASIVEAAGASFVLLGPRHTQLTSRLPVVAVVASRTGAGKSPLAQAIAAHVHHRGVQIGVLRHPMPYGDLRAQTVQRFVTKDDLAHEHCTLEEREEYAPYVRMGIPVYAGVNYARVLEAAEADAQMILWDGGNNDYPFIRPDLTIAVVDALRPGHELRYHPGETNVRAAEVVVITKVGSAKPDDVALVEENVRSVNVAAKILHADLRVSTDNERIAGRRVIVVEDGPTITHGGMPHGAGLVAARNAHAKEIIDPRRFAVGSIAQAYEAHPHVGPVLPALGYSDRQREELADTIRAAAPELVVDASPAAVVETLGLDVPCARVGYTVDVVRGPSLTSIIDMRFETLFESGGG